MSSNRPRSRSLRRVVTWFRGWSLRARLIAALVALLAVACVTIGVASEVAVSRIQMAQLDSQLKSAADRTPHDSGPQHEPGGPQPGGPRGDGPGPPPGTLVMHVGDSGVTAWVIDTDGSPKDLTAAQQAVLAELPVDGHHYTRAIGADEYRLTARRGPDGDVTISGLSLEPLQRAQYALAAVEIAISVTALGLAALLGAFTVRRTLRPLEAVASTASRVAELPLDRGEVALSVRVPDVDPRTEVGQVGAALNRMLGHVARALAARQASETRVRHFVADASHELRTPLAAIRGYAELARRVGNGVPADVAHAMRRVESETARMTVLVEDMLLLARLDSGRPLASEPLDLSRLVIDAVRDAHVTGPDHRWQLDLPEESVTVTGDAARLHQVLANLLANGRAHTLPGTTVTTSVRVSGDAVLLSVADDGPGIPPDLLPEVFDRFARGDTSRSRAAGSTGLGLAIVAAVVEAHRGSVEVMSRPGRTAFTVRLPAEPVAKPAVATAVRH
jgi:two-component system, OmpR family, sensor kinase